MNCVGLVKTGWLGNPCFLGLGQFMASIRSIGVSKICGSSVYTPQILQSLFKNPEKRTPNCGNCFKVSGL